MALEAFVPAWHVESPSELAPNGTRLYRVRYKQFELCRSVRVHQKSAACPKSLPWMGNGTSPGGWFSVMMMRAIRLHHADDIYQFTEH